jgi:hypothetical protein
MAMGPALAGMILATGLALAADPTATQNRMQLQEQLQLQEQEQIYGSQLMTTEERDAFRARMRAATTAEERERIRSEHHEQMKERAKAQGMTLPDTPPQRGGMGYGAGGVGAGGGMGPGKGGNR